MIILLHKFSKYLSDFPDSLLKNGIFKFIVFAAWYQSLNHILIFWRSKMTGLLAIFGLAAFILTGKYKKKKELRVCMKLIKWKSNYHFVFKIWLCNKQNNEKKISPSKWSKILNMSKLQTTQGIV